MFIVQVHVFLSEQQNNVDVKEFTKVDVNKLLKRTKWLATH